ncbi:MAG TPA: metal-dependent hydrolase [Nitrospira sp.]|nr:metal-dependent hydrolase [Nitrospira sp.]
MASPLGHAAVAITAFVACRLPPHSSRYWLLGIACSEAPDLDVVGFWLGIPYESMLGHRGLTHSLLFAILFSWVIAHWAARWGAVEYRRLWTYLFVATASHGVLDALTTGGLGVAFFAPFTNDRFFFSVHPIRVSPLEPSLVFGPIGLAVLKSEVLWIDIPCALFLLVWKVAGRIQGRAKSG